MLNTFVDIVKEIQEMFDDSSFDQVFVRDGFRDPQNNVLVLTLAYPSTYDLSREIFKILTPLQQYEVIYKTTTSRSKNIEIWKLSF